MTQLPARPKPGLAPLAGWLTGWQEWVSMDRLLDFRLENSWEDSLVKSTIIGGLCQFEGFFPLILVGWFYPLDNPPQGMMG